MATSHTHCPATYDRAFALGVAFNVIFVVKQDARDDDAIIADATRVLHDRFGIEHTTLQWDRGPDVCCPRLPG